MKGAIFLYFAVVGLVAIFATTRMHTLTAIDATGDASSFMIPLNRSVSRTNNAEQVSLERLQDTRTSSKENTATTNSTHTSTPPPVQELSTLDEAIETYRARVQATSPRSCTNRTVDLTVAMSCLNLTTPSLQLEYPADAEEHFRELRHALAPWAQHDAHRMHKAAGYAGPWMENYWIGHFEERFDSRNDTGTSAKCLSDMFGPFIPIFIPWVDLWVNNKHRYPAGLVDTLRSVLRPDVPYITVSQNDDGLPGRDPKLANTEIPNVLVLSAGGYGHVPIPLLKQPEQLSKATSVDDRTLLLSYVGSLRNAPNQMRRKVHTDLQQLLSERYKHYYGHDWRRTMADSRFSLAPRGFGRTSYHVMEILQAGLIPVHVYSDVPWVPYADLYVKEIGLLAGSQEMAALVKRLKNMTVDEIRQREEKIVSLRESHFTPDGVLNQIAQFLVDTNRSDLRCQMLPGSTRDS